MDKTKLKKTRKDFKNNVSCAVLTKNEIPQGIVTERDLSSKVIVLNKRPSELAATEIMVSPITMASSRTPVDEIASS